MPFSITRSNNSGVYIGLIMKPEEAGLLMDLLARTGGELSGPRRILHEMYISLREQGIAVNMFPEEHHWTTPSNETIFVQPGVLTNG